VKFLAARRRSPLVASALLIGALATVGGGYAVIAAVQPAQAAITVGSETQVEAGRQLYLEGCSSCHGLEAQGTQSGPTLIGVGAAAVDFQVSSGRMPLAAPGAQAPAVAATYNEEQVAALAAYIGSLAPGPAIPTAEQYDYANADAAIGGELFRINCSQCHQAAGQGGALTQGKYAPNLMAAEPREIYMAMLTGPQSMPVFSDAQLDTESKQHIIKYVMTLQESSNPGGLSLGRLGPVTEGVFLVTAVFAALIAAAVWIGIKSR
jgi:ubiquinol-cytochrome c reductase cytochrome c subunit